MLFAEGSRVLFVGEGDFSFVTSLTEKNSCPEVHVTATSFQTQLTERARNNCDILAERGVSVVLGVDATCLHLHPMTQHLKFTHVIFNFPHVGGKMRIEMNRKLLREFFASAVRVLGHDGRVMVTLCGGQAGVPLDPVIRRWDDSWKLVLMASYADLVIRSVHEFEHESYPEYTPTGYRSMEKGFRQDGALTYEFEVSQLSHERVEATSTADIITCDGKCISIPSFLHSQIQRNLISDGDSLLGHLYSIMKLHLRTNLSVFDRENFVFRKGHQQESLVKCVDECKDLKENEVHCYPCYRINTEQGFCIEPFVVMVCSVNTQALEATLAEPVTLNVRNVSQSFTPEIRNFAFEECIEGKMHISKDRCLKDTVMCYTMSLTLLAKACFGCDEGELWAHGQAVQQCGDIHCYSPFSLFPLEYTYDLSFWEPESSSNKAEVPVPDAPRDKDMTETIIINVGGDVLRSYNLASTYYHPEKHRRSCTYRLVYQSWCGALSDLVAKEIHSRIGQKLEEYLRVEVR